MPPDLMLEIKNISVVDKTGFISITVIVLKMFPGYIETLTAIKLN